MTIIRRQFSLFSTDMLDINLLRNNLEEIKKNLQKKGFEFEPTNGLNWINGQVERIQLDDPSLKIPHMGWNEIAIDYDHAILKDIKNGDHFYFVHSYQMRVFSHEERLAHVDYGGDITAIVAKDNMVGLQFHPEKSSQSGMKLIKNFLEVI